MGETLRQIGAGALDAVLSPARAVQSSDERIYFPYLAGAALLALGVWWKSGRKRSFLEFLAPKEVWHHPSAFFDLRFMIARALVALVVGAPVLVTTAFATTWLRLRLEHTMASPLHVPDPWALGLVSLGAFLAEDFCRYWAHRATHQVPLLWELHKVHHSAEVLTPLTIYRTHPVEGFLMRSCSAVGLALGVAGTAWILGAPISTWEVLGVQGLSAIWNFTGSNLRHSHIWLRYPTWLEHIFISPAQHQLHHSTDRRHFDSNYGSALSLWDYLFGSLLIAKGRPKLTFGLAETERNHGATVVSALIFPMKSAAFRLFPAGLRRQLKTAPRAQEFAHPAPPRS